MYLLIVSNIRVGEMNSDNDDSPSSVAIDLNSEERIDIFY